MRRSRVTVLAITIGLVLFVTVFIAGLAPSNNSDENRRALIIDGLRMDLPNQSFIDDATRLLEEMDYAVDVVDHATVELYERLPSMGYDVVIFKTHGAEMQAYLKSKSDGSLKLIGVSSSLFTTQPYSENQYMLEQQQKYVSRSEAVYNDKPYFTATSFFVKDKMKGKFNDSIIILMSCYGFPKMKVQSEYNIESVPSLLIKKGAKAVIGWEGLVSLDQTEGATINFLEKISSGVSVEDAFTDTKETLGHDPVYGAELKMLTKDMM